MLRLFAAMSGIGICTKTSAGVVLSQDAGCTAACGNRVGYRCTDGCMRIFDSVPALQQGGVRLVRNEQFADGTCYDITVANDGKKIVTLLFPHEEGLEAKVRQLKACGATDRECEIAMLRARGMTRRQISKTLFISLSTVKTHLNNIAKKTPPSDGLVATDP